ncbi:hypothetical protein IQ260_27960 [Leptolyngbya cf. ectocarpi LEGE 11479]|uniref:Transmembrane protein n=1 Tax=Leptolyngbya cf. ectocarpi LEGE 11479 TaxID=1828722 RepID=A0A928ZZW9_LEPEC|nr:hypothetical protein [Leptolyngbya ectocarpi]MBE9070483.1 hypothetical protein [Leptolyngbya cf. ectocarpi LEGE 11479]
MSAFTQNNLAPTERPVSSVVDASKDATSESTPKAKALWSNPEYIGAVTPLLLAAVGCVLGIVVLVTKSESEVKTAGLGLAGTAIAGSAGLAQAKTNRH